MGQPAIQISGPVRNRAPLQTVPASYPSPLEGVGVAICLLGLSIFTTLSTGAVLMYNFHRGAPPFAVNADFFPFGRRFARRHSA